MHPGKTVIGLPYPSSTDLNWVDSNQTPIDSTNAIFDVIAARYDETSKKISVKAYDWTISNEVN